MTRVKEIYAACGWRPDPAELPDHLAVVLEFTAGGDAVRGQRLLETFQPGIELLRAALHDGRGP
ncbi:molecular chaperone TorD family protein [Glycomyces rhizosphaerae]|uniref:Molecular chaperone TorD family protein n=1 Tax=Glycomyces rhizosphaerae TaxID=2054422 RepID=A0ABV7PUV0_9ACTN